jgi:hypothetical protein
MTGRGHKRSAVEIRRAQISRQLEHLLSGLVGSNRARYADEGTHRHRTKRSHELISELEGELLMLDCPGEYYELPIAVVADELGLTYERVRSLIKLGEIEVTGRPAHERICRSELERVATAGVPELLRLSREEPVEIFKWAVPHLQSGDLKAARKAYRRLEARQSWRGPQAPAFLVALELASGELDGATSSMKLIYEHEDPLWRVMVMTYLARVLRMMTLKEEGARELRDQFLMLAEGDAARRKGFESPRPRRQRRKSLDELQRRAIYLTTSVVSELRKHKLCGAYLMADAPLQTLEDEACQIIRNTIYTALYAETFYENSSACRMYADLTGSMIPKSYPPASLLKTLPENVGRDGR